MRAAVSEVHPTWYWPKPIGNRAFVQQCKYFRLSIVASGSILGSHPPVVKNGDEWETRGR